MKSRTAPLWAGVLLLVGLAAIPRAEAKTGGRCLECHSSGFSFVGSPDLYAAAGIADRYVYLSRLSPCPGVKNLGEETFHTESRIGQINRLAAETGPAAAGWLRQTAEVGDSFHALKTEGGASSSDFAKRAAVLRGGLQKVYDRAFEARAESGRRGLVGFSGIVLILLAVLAGLANRRLDGFGKNLLVAGLFCGSLSLGACSPEVREAGRKSTGQERLDQARAAAAKMAARTGERFSAAVLLAEAAGDRARFDPAGSGPAFELAWEMARKAREEGGRIDPLKKIAQEWPDPAEAARQKVNFEGVLDLRDELKALDGRTWALRAVAEEWLRVDPAKGREALALAAREALEIPSGDVRDIELKAIAEARAVADPAAALETVRAVGDPFLKSVSLARIAARLAEPEKAAQVFDEAWKLTATIDISFLKIQARAKISAAAAAALPRQKTEWADRALGAAREWKDPAGRSFAFQELVLSWSLGDWAQAEAFAQQIPADQAEARAFAFIRIGTAGHAPAEKAAGVLRRALDEAGRIQDGFLAQKAVNRALLSLAELNPREARIHLPRLADPVLRSEVQARLVGLWAGKDPDGALKAAESIPCEFTRSRAVLSVLNRKMAGDAEQAAALLREAEKAGGKIPEAYTRALFLVDLGRTWGRIDGDREKEIYAEVLEASSQIPSGSLRAEALETLAAAWKGTDQAKALAVLEGVEAEVLRAREAAAQGKLWARIDPGKARKAVDSIAGNFPIEKAQALQELGTAIKTTQPELAFDFFKQAWALALTIPDGGSKEKILARLVTEAAPLNAEKTLALAGGVSNGEMKDRLLREAGTSLLKEEAAVSLGGALRIAAEISDGHLRRDIYQKAAERAARSPLPKNGAEVPLQTALFQWGKGKEIAKEQEGRAGPFFAKAFAEMEKISDSRTRAYLLAELIADWVPVDEQKALAAAETIAPEAAEALSYGLLKAAGQLRKWNRKQAEAAFAGTLEASEKIADPFLRARRMGQIAGEWRLIDPEKGKEVLRAAAGIPRSPGETAKYSLERYKLFYKETIENILNILEKQLSFAKESNNLRLLVEAALAWSWTNAEKARDILRQIDSKEERAKALGRMAGQMAKVRPEIAASLLEKAKDEARAIEEADKKIIALRIVARVWADLDPAKAKETHRLIFETAQKADPLFRGLPNG